MAKYEKYAGYKDSGIEWLGEIPSHWFLKRHKYIAIFSKGRNPEVLLDNYSDGLYPYLSMDSLRGKADSKYAEYKKGLVLVEDNQPLIIWDGSNSGEFVLGKQGILSSTMASSSLIYNIENKFYWYVCICIEPEMRKHATGMGIPHVNGEELRGIAFPLPDIQEQQKIANFLDYETAKIDSLIEKQQQLIQLLKEKRQAVISHTVTKGLNPNVPMKDSGVEWLGKVPEHWGIITLKYLVIAPIIDGPHVSPIKRDEGIPFISAEAISSSKIDFEKKWGFISKEDHKLFSKRYMPKYGDLLIVKLGATTGSVAMVETDDEFNIWVPLATVRVSQKRLNSKFMYYLFQSLQIKDAIQQSWTFGTQQTLGLGTISNFRIPLPNLEETHQIVEYLDEKLCRFEAIINQAENSLNLLRERRTALISSAVTGKIDVRNWQNPNNNNEDKMELSA